MDPWKVFPLFHVKIDIEIFKLAIKPYLKAESLRVSYYNTLYFKTLSTKLVII